MHGIQKNILELTTNKLIFSKVKLTDMKRFSFNLASQSGINFLSLVIMRLWQKKGLWHRCFPVSFAKFLRTCFVTEHLRWLLLNISFSITIWKIFVKVKKTLNERITIIDFISSIISLKWLCQTLTPEYFQHLNTCLFSKLN